MRAIFFIVVSVLFYTCLFSQSVVIEPHGSNFIPSASTCTTISLGTTLGFERGSNCDAGILVSNEVGASDRDRVISDSFFDITFDENGIYAFFCGAPSIDLAAGISRVCYNVLTPRAVPAIGTYGILLLGLGFLIIGLFAFKQISG